MNTTPPSLSHLGFAADVVCLTHSTWSVQIFREENRQQEMSELLAAGKVPYSIDMDTHPEKLLQGRMCEFP